MNAQKCQIQLCPVCSGKGIVPGGFYTAVSDTWLSTETTELCRTCNGKGVIALTNKKSIIRKIKK